MATCSEFLENLFPNIDPALSSYVNGVLGDGDEFETDEEVYDAVGEILQGADDTYTDEEIREICTSLHQLLIRSCDGASGPQKILTAPVYMGQLDQERDSDVGSSIWMVNQRSGGQFVDKKKLEKAEQQIQKKLDRREETAGATKTNGVTLDEATASQQINKRDAKFDASGSNNNYDIKLENFDIAFGEKSLLAGADLHLVAGRRYGFIGRNGLGKTTVLRMLSKGSLKIPSHIRILHVEQEVTGGDTIATQSVLEREPEDSVTHPHSSRGTRSDGRRNHSHTECTRGRRTPRVSPQTGTRIEFFT